MIIVRQIDMGRKVVYTRGECPFEEGVITSFNEQYVFVRYGSDAHSKATRRDNLEWSDAASSPVRR